jgi:glycerate 2-kinase
MEYAGRRNGGMDERALLRAMFDAAVRAASPDAIVPRFLPPPPKGRTIVVGAGKASAAMARAVEAHWPSDRPLQGLVVTRYGHGVGKLARMEIVEASHPVPDAAGEAAAARILDMVRGLGPDDLVLCLISGGGSALLSSPAKGIALEEKGALNRALLRSGASIHEINCVRKHLSSIKAGRLAAAAAPAQVVSLIISDVPGDDPSVIASGPTVPDATTLAEARAVLKRYAIEPAPSIQARLADPEAETPKPGDPAFARAQTHIVAAPQASLEAAARVAREAGVQPLILSDSLEGEAAEVGRSMAGIARQVVRWGQPAAAPCVLISGGETTVTVCGRGRGGRNVEFLLSLVVELNGLAGVYALAADTDGVDGAEEIAGAVATPDTLTRAKSLGLDAKDRLADNDGHSFFKSLNDSVVTGPTLTNVNDFRAILIVAPGTERGGP